MTCQVCYNGPAIAVMVKEIQMSETLQRAAWTVGGNGNEFADIGGYRYCVDYPNKSGEAFRVLRNGAEIAGPNTLSGPAGYKTADAAKKYAEWFADANA